MPLRVAAIDFLNPAPLLWDFLHPPRAAGLAEHYRLHFTQPSECARQLLAGEADLGLIPIAALTSSLRIVPGCTIAALGAVRSIQLISRKPLADIRSIAADTASRSSVAYVELLLKQFYNAAPGFHAQPADPVAMLLEHDAALLIGDPALLALEQRDAIEAATGPLAWHDVALLWQQHTQLPWVAAVWAVRGDLTMSQRERERLFIDLNSSRKHGQLETEALVEEWAPRIAIPRATIRTYLTENIHYLLNDQCRQTIATFRQMAASHQILPPLPTLPMLEL